MTRQDKINPASPLGRAGAAKSTIVAAPVTYQRIARVAGEAIDADQITPNCECCGLNEYACECDPFYDPEPRKSREEIEAGKQWATARFAEAMFPNLRKPEGFERVEL